MEKTNTLIQEWYKNSNEKIKKKPDIYQIFQQLQEKIKLKYYGIF